MRRKDKEITDQEIIRHILANSSICRIGLTDGETAYIVPLNYGFSSGALYFHAAPNGKKMDLLKKNNRVCFEIEYAQEIVKGQEPCDWTTRYRSVIGYGEVEVITGHEEKKKGLDVIMAHYGKSGENRYDEASLARMVILKLTITGVTGKESGDW